MLTQSKITQISIRVCRFRIPISRLDIFCLLSSSDCGGSKDSKGNDKKPSESVNPWPPCPCPPFPCPPRPSPPSTSSPPRPCPPSPCAPCPCPPCSCSPCPGPPCPCLPYPCSPCPCPPCPCPPCPSNPSAVTLYDCRKYGHSLPSKNETPCFDPVKNMPTGIFRCTNAERLGPGAAKCSHYKNPEYFSYHHMTYYDAHLLMRAGRKPSPVSGRKPC